MRKRCFKGKSCGATCIDPRERCVLELGPLISDAISKVKFGLGEQFLKQVAPQKVSTQTRSMPIDLRNALAGLPPPPSNSAKTSMTALPSSREELMALRRATLLKFIDEKDPVAKNKLEAKIDAIDRKLEAQKKLPSKWPTFVTPPPTTSSEIRKDIASIVKDASTPPAERAKARLMSQLGVQTGGPEREGFMSMYGSVNTNNLKSFGKIQLDALKEALSYGDLSSGAERKFRSEAGKLSANLKRLDNSPASSNTKWARNEAVDSDRNLGKVLRVGDKNYNGWKDSYGTGSTKVGEGSFGTVIKNPDGTFVKRGAVSSTEAQLIKRLGEANLGPKLIAADINGKHEYMDAKGVNMRDGRIAMTAVEGSPLGQGNPYSRRGGEFAPNIYWKAMAELHRLGIAHNDAHIDNILVDGKGKGRWVDLGLAQSSPKAALAEALGTFKPPTGSDSGFDKGNWQTRRWQATGIPTLETYKNDPKQLRQFKKDMPALGRVVDNLGAVNSAMKDKYGLTSKDITSIYEHGIRSPLSSYTKGAWGKMTDQQAQELLNQLYEGV